MGIDRDGLAQLVDGHGTKVGIVLDGVLGEDADVVGLLQDIHDGVDIADERYHVQVARLGVYEALDGVAVAQSLLGQYEFVRQQVGKVEYFLLGQRVIGAHDGCQTVFQQGGGVYELVRAGGHHGEHDVYLVLAQHAQQVAQALVVGIDLDAWVLGHEGQHRLAYVGFQTVGQSDVECAAEQSLQVGYAVVAFGYAMQHLLGQRQQFLTAFGKQDAVGLAHEQLCAEFLLQQLDLLRYGTLCDEQHAGGFGEAPGLGNSYEIL